MMRQALNTILVTLLISAIVAGKSVVTVGDNDVNIKTREQAQNSETADQIPDPYIPEVPPTEGGEGQSLLPNQLGKRSVGSDPSYVHTVVSRSDSPVTVIRAELQTRSRRKRTVVDMLDKWNYTIPYVFDESYLNLGDNLVNTVRRAFRHISNHVCVKYEDVTNKYDPANEHWFTENGFATDAYLLIKDGGGCAAGSGQGNGVGPKNVSPCKGFGIIMHEILHTLGGVHYQQIANRDNYLTVNRDNVQPSLQGTYDISNPDKGTLIGTFMDPRSDLMYGDQTWTQNGLSTYEPVREEIFVADVYASTEEIVFEELSKVHKCNEKYCNGAKVDCGLGYHTIVNGVCQCVCPREWDPATNCKELIKAPASDRKWPKTPVALYAGGPNHECPTGFDKPVSWVSFTGIWPTLQKPVPYSLPAEGETMYSPVCEKSAPANEEIDWESWPLGGAYCIVKPKGTPCGGVFVEFTFEVESQKEVQRNGSAGDITVVGKNITTKLCCRYSENYALPLTLPNDKPFRFVAKGACPIVDGMRAYKGLLDFYAENKKAYGPLGPQFYIFAKELQIFQCYYQPPVYGCNRVIKLDAQTRSAQITTPGYPNAREANKRCLYHFDVPSNAQVKITFDDYDPHPEDMVIEKRFHKWQVPYQIPNDNYPYEFLSEKNYLFMEYWASWQTEGVTNKGIKFTAQVILPEDLCYDHSTNGEDYQGGTDITETYEACLPWSEAADCADFPDEPLASVWLMWSGGNNCRNPGGKLLQPWCYTYKNGTNCFRHFCDVCNLQAPVDKLKTCDKLIAEDKSFCKTGIQRFGCFKSCGFSQRQTNEGTCSAPIIPSDGKMVGQAKSVYKTGEKVLVTCADPEAPKSTYNIFCTQKGWTPLKQVCNEDKNCTNKAGFWPCRKAMTENPNFCRIQRLRETIEESCRDACGFCDLNAQCDEEVGDTYVRTSALPTINAGEAMTFACKDGYYHVSGDLQRACFKNGKLLGNPPVCQAEPVAQDINLHAVISRHQSIPNNRAVLLDHDGYRVPFKGSITKWFYHCKGVGRLHFLVYRKSGDKYTFVGANNITCVAGWPWSYNVPAADQISVQKDDIIGIFTPDRPSLSGDICEGAPVPVLPNPSVFTRNPGALPTLAFSETFCLVPSVGARVEPN